MNKVIIPATLIASIAVVSVFSVATIQAKGNPDNMGTLPAKIATTFNLDQTQVENVFNQQREEMHAQRETEMNINLDQLVTEGKLTQTQKAEFLAMHEKMEDQMDFSQRGRDRDGMQEHRDKVQQWASDNGLDFMELMGDFMNGNHKFQGHRYMMNNR